MSFEYTTNNGNKVMVAYAGFEDACDLKDAIEEELLSLNTNLTAIIKNIKDKGGLNAEVLDVVDILKDSFLVVDKSKKVREALFKCLARCTYNGEKITKRTFENMEAVKDYYEVIFGCLQANLSPFFGSLFTLLSHNPK